ncbi:8517_t:CDS:10, partial [Ambispora leptoticha]
KNLHSFMSSERVQANSLITNPIEVGKRPSSVFELDTFVFGRPRQQPPLQEEGFRLSILHSQNTIESNNSNLQTPEINVFAQPLFRKKPDSEFSVPWKQQQESSGGADFAQEKTGIGGAKTQSLFAFQMLSDNNHNNNNSIHIPEKLPEINLISREEENNFPLSSSDLSTDDPSPQDGSKADFQSSTSHVFSSSQNINSRDLSNLDNHTIAESNSLPRNNDDGDAGDNDESHSIESSILFSQRNETTFNSDDVDQSTFQISHTMDNFSKISDPLATRNRTNDSSIESNNRINDIKKTSQIIQISENKSEEDEFSMIMDVVKKWRSEVKRRDTEINKLSDTIDHLRKDLLRRDETIKQYSERIKCVEVLIKRQFTDTDRNRQRIGELNKLAFKFEITKETNASLIGTQRAELEQLRECNSKLMQDNVQANEIINKSREELQQSILHSSRSASELEASHIRIKTLTSEYDLLKSNHIEEVQKLKLDVERAENQSQVESEAKKECEEKINLLTVKVHQHEVDLESMHRENERLNVAITEKENQILSLKSIETQRKSLQAELDHVKENTNKQINDLYQEIENLRTHQKAERQRLENEGREEICRLQEDFLKKRTAWEQQWHDENARLESECREEREQRSKLESKFHEKGTENLRLEAELRNSQVKLDEIMQSNKKYKNQIEDLEKQLCQYVHPKIESFSIGVGTAEIPEIDVLIQHEKFIAESDRELSTTKNKITELNKALELSMSKFKSIESELASMTVNYNKLLEEHNKLTLGTSNTEVQKKNAVDQALNRAQLYYQDLAKRAAVQHENEIRKRDCKLREAEIRESTLNEEIRSLRSKLLQVESKDRASTEQMAQLPNTEIKLDVQLMNEQKTNKQTQIRSVVSPSLYASSNTIEHTEASVFNQLPKHESTDNACSKYLTLSEINSMVIDSIEQKNPSITETKVEESQMTIKKDIEDSIGIGSSQDHPSGRVVPSLNDNTTTKQNKKNDEWQSPGTQLRAKRRKISRVDSKDNLQPSSSSDKSSAAPTNIGDSNRPTTKTSLRILDMIQKVFQNTLDQQDFQNRLQLIKAAFYNRDYDAVFTDHENLSVYSARYIPGRALCYFNLIKNEPKILELFGNNNNDETRVFSVGSGAGSELVGFVTALFHHQISSSNNDSNTFEGKLILHMQDYVDWSKVLNSLELTIREQWNISHNKLECLFSVDDVLEPTQKLKEQFAKADLITFMFVMNELFINKKKAIEMIQLLVKMMRKGSHLLVGYLIISVIFLVILNSFVLNTFDRSQSTCARQILDSAGSFSNIKIGENTYMIYFLLDALKGFTPVISNNSTWYRYPEDLKYHKSAPLENMRYYIRLYRKD